MEHPLPPPRSDRLRRPRLLAIALAVSTAPLFLLAALPRLAFTLPGAAYVALHALVEIALVVVCFTTFAVQWYAAGAEARNARARFVAAAFLGVGLLEAVHLLAFPAPVAFASAESTGHGIWYWLSARAWTVASLLASAFVPVESDRPWLRRSTLLGATVAIAALVIGAEAAFPGASGAFYAGGAVTSVKRAIELAIAAGAGFAAVLHARDVARGEEASRAIAAALALMVLSQLCFALYGTPYDAFNLLGHVYLAVAFYLVFDALFVSTLLWPYARLRATSAELSAKNAELEALRRHVEEELAVTIARLRDARELQDDLVRAVTHDVRTPLQVILFQAERLARIAGEQGDERVLRSAVTAVASARRIDAMLRDLVDSARLDRGAVRLEPRPVSLPALVRDLLAGSAGVLDVGRVEMQVPDDLPRVRADASRLERILANLVSNALKYSEPGTPVRVAAARQDRVVRVSVADRGRGIPAEELPRIFDRFFRGRGAAGEGLGLGLYIVRMLVEAHGGTVSAESTIGEGSVVSFTLPADA